MTAAPLRPIYLDYHATTPADPRVAAVVLHHLTTAFGNASSADHAYGDEAHRAVEDARREVALLVGASPRDVVFVSGATEALNLAILGFARAHRARGHPRPVRIGLTPVEHRAVLDPLLRLERAGEATLTWLSVDGQGRLDLHAFETACRHGLDLACVIAANNEVGTVTPLDRIAAIATTTGVALLSDATQAAGKLPLGFADWGLTFLALSAHKMYGPKGVGALVRARTAEVEPLVYGGGQERGLRSGTLNVPGIAGLGEACRLRRTEMEHDELEIAARRDRLQALLEAGVEGLVINGDVGHRLAGNLHVSVPGAPSSAVVARLRDAVAIARGAACSSGVEAPSHVLRALRLPDALVESALRIGIGKFTTDDEVDRAATAIVRAVREVRLAVRGDSTSSCAVASGIA